MVDHQPERQAGQGKAARAAVHDDLVRRDFHAPAPNLLWLTDITEHPTAEGKLYCCAIKDVFSNRIVGYALDERMTAQLAVAALRSALARRQPEDVVIVHSDRGPSFDLGPSLLSSPSFFNLLQTNVLNRRSWRTRAELHYEIVRWIEHTYNRRRRQRGLGRLTPVEFELAFASQLETDAVA